MPPECSVKCWAEHVQTSMLLMKNYKKNWFIFILLFSLAVNTDVVKEHTLKRYDVEKPPSNPKAPLQERVILTGNGYKYALVPIY